MEKENLEIGGILQRLEGTGFRVSVFKVRIPFCASLC